MIIFFFSNKIQRIYHSSNPFLDKLTECERSTPKEVTIDLQTQQLNGVNEQTDNDCHSSQLSSLQSQESSIPNQEQSTEEKEIQMVEEEEKFCSSDKKNNSAEDHRNFIVSSNAPLKYFLTKNLDNNFRPASLKLEKKFNYFTTPQDFCLNTKGNIVVADTGNHRIGVSKFLIKKYKSN